MTLATRRARTTSEIVERARLIAESLELGVAGHNGVLLTRGERLERPDREVALPETAASRSPR